jgi:type I restriction enzyme R subunit
MKPKFNEDTLSEQPAIEQLKRLNYVYIHGDVLDPELKDDCERSSRREVVLISRLKKKLAEINPHLTEESIDKAVRRVTHIQAEGLMEANQKFHQDLVAGISIDQDIGARRQKQTVRFVDFDDPENNEFLIVNQLWVKGPKETCRPDRHKQRNRPTQKISGRDTITFSYQSGLYCSESVRSRIWNNSFR